MNRKHEIYASVPSVVVSGIAYAAMHPEQAINNPS
jgi:hypothetical protein